MVKAKRRGGLLRVDVPANETAILLSLLLDLRATLASEDLTDPVVRRLYPDGYEANSEAAAEFRELVAGTLRTERTARLEACQRELPAGGGRMELDDEATDRWLRVLNDLRLAIGTRLGVSESEELDETLEPVQIYHWLSAVQDTLVQNLMP